MTSTSHKCLECRNFSSGSTDGDKKMARHGFGICSKKKPWEYYPAMRERDCKMFEPAKAEDISKRKAFFERREGNGK